MIKQKIPSNIKLTDQQAGFGSMEILLVVVVIGLIGGLGVFVAHRHSTSSVNSQHSSSSQSAGAASPLSAKASDASTVPTPSTSKSTTSSSTSKTSTSNSTAKKPTTSTTKTITPIMALTAIISDLDKGTGDAHVTAVNVPIAGPITMATGRPLVFTANGKTYFAYTQGTKPNFNQSAAQTAETMAITAGSTSGVALSQVHLDKSGNLVDEDEMLVGYSTGGS